LEAHVGDVFPIQTISHQYFLSNRWESTTALVAFPGGRDLPYHSKLQGEANARIRRYVETGGRYLGICAGGYYGSASIEFEKGGELEICGQRELAFFSGKAVGPAYGLGLFQYNSERGAKAAKVIWDKKESSVYFNGGCFFQSPEDDPFCQVIARYGDLSETPAAVVFCQCGKGAALLSGVHPEYSNKDPFFSFLINKILT
jgi:biotin--protein ligase